MFPTGIDWSEKHLDFCITNERGDVILRERVDNDDDGFKKLLQSFEKENIDFTEIAVAIKSPHQRVVGFDTLRGFDTGFDTPSATQPKPQPKDFLLARGVDIYPVNPWRVRRDDKPSRHALSSL